VELCSGFDQAVLASRQCPCNQLNRVDAVRSHMILVICMEIGRVVWGIKLDIHTNDDTKETAEFGHGRILCHETGKANAAG
jgi:hypothetical protein